MAEVVEVVKWQLCPAERAISAWETSRRDREALVNPGNYKAALARIKQLHRDGKTKLTHHAQMRMAQRHKDMNDVAQVFRYGRVTEHSKPMDYWRYTILGKAVDGDPMKCVVEINDILKIVTVI